MKSVYLYEEVHSYFDKQNYGGGLKTRKVTYFCTLNHLLNIYKYTYNTFIAGSVQGVVVQAQ